MALHKFTNEKEWLAARMQDITSTELAALLGMSEYKSRLKLWMIKAGKMEDDFEESNQSTWGKRLQNAVGQGIAEDNGWECFDLTGYYLRDEEARIGASMDMRVVCPERGPGLLEVKTTGYFQQETGWEKTRAPIDYEFQLQGQVNLAIQEGQEIGWGCIGALDGRKNTRKYDRMPDAPLWALIKEETAKFWHSIKINEPPAPDYAVDADLIRKLQGSVNVEQNISLTGNNRAHYLIEQYMTLEAAREQVMPLLKDGETKIDAIKAELHHMAGNAETVLIGDYRINCSLQHREERLQKDYTYRIFKVSKTTKGRRK